MQIVEQIALSCNRGAERSVCTRGLRTVGEADRCGRIACRSSVPRPCGNITSWKSLPPRMGRDGSSRMILPQADARPIRLLTRSAIRAALLERLVRLLDG